MVKINVFDPVADKNTILLISVTKIGVIFKTMIVSFFLFIFYKNINSSGEFLFLCRLFMKNCSLLFLVFIYIYLYIIYNLMIGPQSRSVRFSSAFCTKEKQYYYQNIHLMALLHT